MNFSRISILHSPFSILSLLLLSSCIGWPGVGNHGEPCSTRGVCMPGLVCGTQRVCVRPGEATDGGVDAGKADAGRDAGGDAGPDTGRPDADAGADAGVDGGAAEFTCANSFCTDPATGFEWQQEPTGGKMEWSKAITHCRSLDLSGTGWRLPNISELRSLIRNCEPIEMAGACGVKDECPPCGVSSESACLGGACWTDIECNPSSCTDDGGPTGCYWPQELIGNCSWYWSSSSNADASSTAWAWGVPFDNGKVDDGAKDLSYDARCVRGGP